MVTGFVMRETPWTPVNERRQGYPTVLLLRWHVPFVVLLITVQNERTVMQLGWESKKSRGLNPISPQIAEEA